MGLQVFAKQATGPDENRTKRKTDSVKVTISAWPSALTRKGQADYLLLQSFSH
jgi:hypothetical protein